MLLALLPLPAAQAGIEIVIPEVTEQLQNNIRAFLSLTRYAERDDVTPETMSRLQRRIVSETRAALEPLGYYEPEVTYETVQEGESWRVTIHVKPGRPVRLSEVSVSATGPGAQQRAIQEVIELQELKPGLRLNHGAYEHVKGALLRAAKNDGYLDARLTKNDLVIDRQERRANATIEMDTGRRYSYGAINVAQDVIDDDSMRRLLRMKEGDPYTLDSLLRTQYVLDDSQYFSTVDIETGTVDREALTVPVTVSAQPNRRHRFATSLGYGTDTEVRGKFTWDNRRVNSAGHRFKLELLGSSIIKELGARYVIPVMDVALEKLEFTGKVVEEEIGDTESQRAEIGSGLTQVQGRWQRVLFVRLSNETTTEGDGSRNTAFYVFPGISYSTLPSYIVGGKARPYRLYFELRGSPTTLGSDVSFLQFRFQGERIFDFAERWHLDLRAEFGTTRLDSNRPTAQQILDLPASQRFFAGGDRSVRGFSLNELAPRDENGDSVGGKHLATGTIEVVRDLPRNFGVAAFYDIGNAFDDFKEPGFEYSLGLGVRYSIAVASFGIDVAQPISESGRNPRFHLYISTQF
ncbi:MAG TPA: autotransporter assembly complex family protein [Steroidobacteraceae bacterium]|nr:autotransporter assembly complex family protein [Steroidobacteraceae bacterium]